MNRYNEFEKEYDDNVKNFDVEEEENVDGKASLNAKLKIINGNKNLVKTHETKPFLNNLLSLESQSNRVSQRNKISIDKKESESFNSMEQTKIKFSKSHKPQCIVFTFLFF